MRFFTITMRLFSGLLIFLFFSGIQLIDAQTIKFVATDGTGDGSSWANAASDFQNIIDNSDANTQIWVKAGTYYAPSDTGFYLKDQVSLFGGFAGTETDLSQRTDYRLGGANETILSGDIDNDGILDEENAENVVRGFNISPATIIDGFTVQYGYADKQFDTDDGGGMYLKTSDPVIMNCTFFNNYCIDNGGAIYCRTGAEPVVMNSFFISNYAADKGAGIYSQSSGNYPFYANCVFTNNEMQNYSGVVYMYHNSATAANCTFVNNKTPFNDAASVRIYQTETHYNNDPATGTVTNCAFYGNEADTVLDLSVSDFGIAVINNCAVSGTVSDGAYVTSNNIIDISTADTLFTNYAGTPGMDGYDPALDLSLPMGSPLIDAGTLTGAPEIDILGLPRDATPDIGAYEFFATGIEDIRINNFANIFPNPSNGTLYIKPVSDNLNEITVTDITGHTIKVLNINNREVRILNLNRYSKGVYFINMQDNNGRVKTEKIIIK